MCISISIVQIHKGRSCEEQTASGFAVKQSLNFKLKFSKLFTHSNKTKNKCFWILSSHFISFFCLSYSCEIVYLLLLWWCDCCCKFWNSHFNVIFVKCKIPYHSKDVKQSDVHWISKIISPKHRERLTHSNSKWYPLQIIQHTSNLLLMQFKLSSMMPRVVVSLVWCWEENSWKGGYCGENEFLRMNNFERKMRLKRNSKMLLVYFKER